MKSQKEIEKVTDESLVRVGVIAQHAQDQRYMKKVNDSLNNIIPKLQEDLQMLKERLDDAKLIKLP